MNGLSKRLVSLTMATAMVFSLTAVPATEAKAATASITSKTTSVQADKTYTYKIKASKAKTVKVSVSGTAAKAVRVNGKKATSGKNTITLKGGKTITVKVKVNPSKTVAGKKFTINYKLDKKKAVKTKSIKVNYSTKGVTLDQTALTMKAGETATLKATMTTVGTNSKIKDWTSSNEAVATVKGGVVTAVAAGTADITVTTSNGKTAKATVTVEETEKKPEAFTLTAEATKADTITGTLSREVAADAVVTVMKEGLTTAVDGKATITGTTVEFKGTANFTKGTYTITVKEGELSADAKVTVQDEYVAEIKITSTQALTNATPTGVTGTVEIGEEAYAYYDVVNQYGESMRNSVSITWTSSTFGGKPSVDKSTGRLTFLNNTEDAAFVYGTEIYVTGVYTKTGVSVNKAIKVGLAQSLNSVKAVGFVNKNEPTKLLKDLPVDFGKGTYYMLYEVRDQDEQLLPASTTYAANQVSFISDAPLLIQNKFTDAPQTFTIDGVEYSAVTIEPGDYSDKGGEVNITAIATKTGNKSYTNFVVGAHGVLQSLVLSAPSKVVADGDKDVEIPFVAKDTEGNTITNYETIVRSSNTLSLNAGDNTYLSISEKNDGTAVIKWTDNNPHLGDATYPPDTYDGTDRTIALTTIVVGGESNNLMLSVADKRIPAAIKSISVNKGADALVSGATENIYFFGGTGDGTKDGQVVYLDQYGEDMTSTRAGGFFSTFESLHKYGNGTDAANYAVYVDYTNGTSAIPGTDKEWKRSQDTGNGFPLRANVTAGAILNDTVKWSIASKDTGAWQPTGKIKSVSYSVVPVEKLNSIEFATLNTMHLTNAEGDADNGELAGITVSGNELVSNGSVSLATTTFDNMPCNRKLSLSGLYNGKALSIPDTYWNQTDSNFVVAGNTLNGVSSNVVRFKEIYDANTSKLTRKTTTKQLTADVYNSTTHNSDNKVTSVVLNIKMTDAPRVLTTLEFYEGEKSVVNPGYTYVNLTDEGYDSDWDTANGRFTTKWYGDTIGVTTYNTYQDARYSTSKKDWAGKNIGYKMLDQYNEDYTNAALTFKVTDIKENEGEFAHVINNFNVLGNGTRSVALKGAELGDTFTLTVSAVDNNNSSITLSDSIAVTVGADWAAWVGESGSSDKGLRTAYLSYER